MKQKDTATPVRGLWKLAPSYRALVWGTLIAAAAWLSGRSSGPCPCSLDGPTGQPNASDNSKLAPQADATMFTAMFELSACPNCNGLKERGDTMTNMDCTACRHFDKRSLAPDFRGLVHKRQRFAVSFTGLSVVCPEIGPIANPIGSDSGGLQSGNTGSHASFVQAARLGNVGVYQLLGVRDDGQPIPGDL